MVDDANETRIRSDVVSPCATERGCASLPDPIPMHEITGGQEAPSPKFDWIRYHLWQIIIEDL